MHLFVTLAIKSHSRLQVRLMPKLNLSLSVHAIVQDHQGYNQMLDFSYDMDQGASGLTQEAYVDTVDCGDEIL